MHRRALVARGTVGKMAGQRAVAMRRRASYPDWCNYAVVIYSGASSRKKPRLQERARPQTAAAGRRPRPGRPAAGGQPGRVVPARRPARKAHLTGGPVAGQACAHSAPGPPAAPGDSAVRVGAGGECHDRRSPAAVPGSLPPPEPPAPCDPGPAGRSAVRSAPAPVDRAAFNHSFALTCTDVGRFGVSPTPHIKDRAFVCQLDSTTLGNEFVTQPPLTL